MATTAQSDGATVREFVERVRGLPDHQLRELASTNFILFCNVVTYNWIEGNDRNQWPGKSFDWYPTPDHFESWYDRVRGNDLNMFLAARKHTKTTFACALMMYRSEYEDGHVSLYWANTENQVKERMEELDEMIEANPWLQNLHTDNSLLRKEYENGSRIRTTWVQGAAEGGHVDLSLGDDPMKEFADVPDSRIEEWYGKVIVPMLNPHGLHAIIGTRKRPNDLYEILRAKHEQDDSLEDLPSYTLTEYPAIREAWLDEYDRPGDLAPLSLYTECDAPGLADALGLPHDTLHILWPEARPPEWLAKNLGGQGKPYFLREFCMVFTQAEDAVVQRPWIERVSSDDAPPSNLGDPWTPTDYPEALTRSAWDSVVVGVDPAGQGRDRFAFVTVGELTHPGDDDMRIRHVLDVWQAQDVPPSKFRSKLTALHDRYRPDAIALEANLNQTWVAEDDEIPAQVRKVLRTISTTRRKHSWKDGVPSIGSDIERGAYRFYMGGEKNQTSELVTALTSITMHDGELVGHTPDSVMALYMAHKALGDDSGKASSSRSNLQYGSRSESEKQREENDRAKKESLRGNPIGDAILSNRDSW